MNTWLRLARLAILSGLSPEKRGLADEHRNPAYIDCVLFPRRVGASVMQMCRPSEPGGHRSLSGPQAFGRAIGFGGHEPRIMDHGVEPPLEVAAT